MSFALPGLLLLLTVSAVGQVEVGDNLSMGLSGVMTGGYSGLSGNQIAGSHGLNFGGSGTLAGSYYNPNFLSFNLSPYYNQDRQNSTSRALLNSSGFDFNSNIFAGSHFPGTVGYSKAWDSLGNFAVPGVADFTTRSNNQSFNIGWSELLPDWPTLTAAFTTGSNEYSIFGSDQNGNNGYHNFMLRSTYSVKGFNLSGTYNTGSSHATIPMIFGSQTTERVNSDNNSFVFTASHLLPMHGSFSSSFSRSYMNSDYLGSSYHGTVDTVNASAGFNPKPNLNLSFGLGYTDSLSGSLYQTILPGTGLSPGGTQPAQSPGGPFQQSQQSSNSLYLISSATYSLGKGLIIEGDAQRRQQEFLGKSYGANTFGGYVSYTHGFLGGFLSTSLGLADSNNDYTSGNSLSFSTNVTYSRALQQWFVSGNFSYAQNVQTYLVTYLSSYYNFSGNVRRPLFDGHLIWSASAAGARSGLNYQPHTGNSSSSYTTSIGTRRLTASAAYAKSDGYGLLGGTGVVLPPSLPPGAIPPEWVIFYGGTSHSYSLGMTPARHLSMGASFSRAKANTSTGGIPSWNDTEQVNTILNYQVRKLMFTAGYSRLIQGFSASGLPAANVNSYYCGFSRSFKLF